MLPSGIFRAPDITLTLCVVEGREASLCVLRHSFPLTLGLGRLISMEDCSGQLVTGRAASSNT